MATTDGGRRRKKKAPLSEQSQSGRRPTERERKKMTLNYSASFMNDDERGPLVISIIAIASTSLS